MPQFIIRRVLYSLVTLLILSATIFLVVRFTGDPVALMAEASARPEDLDRIRQQWGLDRSWPVQYVTFMQNAFKGELGKSFNYRLPVSELYFQRLPNSLTLGLSATLISLLIGVPAGIISAVKVTSWWDNVAKGVALLGLSIPGFWLGLVLILMFSVWLRWLPTSGAGDWRHVVMPALALGWYFAASMLRLTRSSMLEVLGSEYIKLARLKGLPDVVVIAMHAFKNALIPVFTLAGVNMVVMVNAAVIIEVIFAWPGIGRLLYEGIFQRDFPLVQGVVARRPDRWGGGDLGDRHRHRHRPREPGGHLRGVPAGERRLCPQAGGDGLGPDPRPQVRGATRRAHLGEEPARAGLDVHLLAPGAPMASELILIIEDNEKNRKLERDILQFYGYRTIEADTAEDGITLAQATPPALVLMDIQLPGMSGIEALHYLRADPRTRAIPVIAVTASAMTHDRQQIMAAGFDGYQAKPIDVTQFVAAVRQAVA